MSKPPVLFLAFANDRSGTGQHLRNLPKELDSIRSALRPLEKAGICELVIRSNATLKQIIEVFQDSDYRNRIAIFHYGGHAGSYQMLLEDLEGVPKPVQSEGFNHFLGTSEGLKLVFLNACSTESQARDLITGGVPLVVGTSQAIRDTIAAELAIAFYEGIAQGIDFGKAWEDAQQGLMAATEAGNLRGLYLEVEHEIRDQIPWKMHVRPGSSHTLQDSLPGIANNPLFGLPNIPESFYLRLPPKPFVNLRHFRQEDAAIFFGRGREIRDLYLRLKGIHPIILFYGQSGVGKSSLLEAGLLPRLESEYVVSYVRRDPLVGLPGSIRQGLAELSGQAERALPAQWLQIEKASAKPFLLILDQVEEVFTKASEHVPEKELSELMAEIAAIFDLSPEQPKGKIILAFRKEYAPDVRQQVEEQALPYTELYLNRLSRTGIMEAISGVSQNPLTQQKYKLTIQQEASADLPVIIADDLLEDRSAALAPILQILLSRMWEKSQDYHFSLSLYQSLKRDGILLQDFFDRQLKELETWNAAVVHSGLALDLLQRHTTPLGTAATVSVDILANEYAHQSSILPQVIQRFKDLYLLTQNGPDGTSLSHDTLAPVVQKAYKVSDKPGQRALRILESKSLEGRFEKSSILEENDLKTVESGQQGMRAWTEAEKVLIEKSRAQIEQKNKRKKQIQALGIVAVTIILLFGVLATIFWQSSIKNKKQAKALYLVSVSKKEFEKSPAGALRIAEAAYYADSIAPQAAVSQQLTEVFHHAYLEKKPLPVAILKHESGISGSTFSGNGDRILTWSKEGTLKLWDLQGQLVFEIPQAGSIEAATFSNDDRRILSLSADGKAKLWDLQGQLVFEIPQEGSIEAATFSNDDRRILSLSADGKAKLWDLQGQLVFEIPQAGSIEAATFSNDDRQVLTLSVDGNAKLWDLQRKLPAELKHTDSVNGAIFSSSNRHILTWSEDGTAKLWDLRGQLLAELKHNAGVWKAIFSADGSRILTNSRDTTTRLWDLQGQLLIELEHDDAWLWDATFSSDGSRIMTSDYGMAKLWDLQGQFVGELTHEDRMVGSIFPDNSPYILTWPESADGTARLWDLQGQLLAELIHEDWIDNAIFSGNDRYVLTWSADGTAKVWDLQQQPLVELRHESLVEEADFSVDGSHILSWTPDEARLWDLQGQLAFELKHEGSINGATFSDDGRHILTWSADEAGLWDLQGQAQAEFKHEAYVRGATFSGDSRRILTYANDGTTKLWDLQGQLLAELKHEAYVRGATFSGDSRQILTYANDGATKLWDLRGQLLAELRHEDNIRGATFSGDSRQILTYAKDSTLKLWDLRGQLLAELKHENAVWGADFSADGRHILTISRDSTFKLWDLQGQLLAELRHEDETRGAKFSDRGHYILSWSADGTLKLWDLRGQLLAELRHEEAISGAIFSADGHRILSWSLDGTAKLWDLQGRLLADLIHKGGSVNGAKFSADGHRILSWSTNEAKLWFTPEGVLEWLKTAPIPMLSTKEWNKYNISDSPPENRRQ